MPEDLTELISPKRPRPDRPLVGMTVLVVEDSRFDSEAIRLLCQRSGARLRRADSLLHARRHLSLYRPTVVMVDVGLPDGSGLDLIRELNGAVPRVPILMAISGDPTARQSALDSGAQDFLEKPVRSLVQFQQTMLAHLPIELRHRGPRLLNDAMVQPDEIALKDDLRRVAHLLERPCSASEHRYAAQLLSCVANSADDDGLADAARCLSSMGGLPNQGRDPAIRRVSDILQQRLSGGAPI